MVFDLMCDLNATEDQLDFPVVYGSAKNNWMGEDYNTPTDNINYLLDKIIEVIPAPKQLEGTPQMLITSLDYSNYTGRIAVGRVHRGTITEGMKCTIAHRDGTFEKTQIKEVHTFEGMGRQKTQSVSSGDICAVVGLDNFEIGDTICDFENPEPLPTIAIDEPTMSMLFAINDSPFFGKEGKFCTSRHINDRLEKELEKDLALRVKRNDTGDSWIVSGRGVLHLSICETMRREGYELQVGQPQVIYKEIDGQKCEPIEELTINVPEEFASKMIDMVTRRKGEMTSMQNLGERIDIEFDIPSRRYHRFAYECAHGFAGRGYHGTPLQGLPALQGRHSAPSEWFDDFAGIGHGFCLCHRPLAGSRSLLHQSAGRSVCRTGGGRTCSRQ